MDADATPVLLVGAGHMGGALVAGWRLAGALTPDELMMVDPHPGKAAAGGADVGRGAQSPGR